MNFRDVKELFAAIKETPKGVMKRGIIDAYTYYCRSCCGKSDNSIEIICYNLRILTHVIEKALSLPVVNKGFGKGKVRSLLYYLDQYIELNNHEYDPQVFDYAVAALQAYVDNATKYECDISFIDLDKYIYHVKKKMQSGVAWFESSEYHEKIQKMNFREFAESRHSIRAFSEKRIPKDLMMKAVLLSQTAPSACNRQSVKLIHITEPSLCKKVLDIQGGAKGHSATEIVLVASDLDLYRYYSERNTPYVDGGIYAMNLIYAMSYYGIGTCPLIWDDYGEKGEKLRKLINIPDHFHVVVVLQIGLLLEGKCKYALSSRRPIDEIYYTEEAFKT